MKNKIFIMAMLAASSCSAFAETRTQTILYNSTNAKMTHLVIKDKFTQKVAVDSISLLLGYDTNTSNTIRIFCTRENDNLSGAFKIKVESRNLEDKRIKFDGEDVVNAASEIHYNQDGFLDKLKSHNSYEILHYGELKKVSLAGSTKLIEKCTNHIKISESAYRKAEEILDSNNAELERNAPQDVRIVLAEKKKERLATRQNELVNLPIAPLEAEEEGGGLFKKKSLSIRVAGRSEVMTHSLQANDIRLYVGDYQVFRYEFHHGKEYKYPVENIIKIRLDGDSFYSSTDNEGLVTSSKGKNPYYVLSADGEVFAFPLEEVIKKIKKFSGIDV
ncbi:hypothetical protein AB4133_01715 [Vibrio sp. 10N.286.52.F8]|uniref:hypothetical protein n=1 Tax=unclassified Vibrio TaxID=2614977 RepID=UPI003551F3C8